MRGLRRVAACVLPTLATGCSFVFASEPEPPPRHRPPPAPECSTSRAAPIVDTVIAGYELYRTGVAIDASNADYADAEITRGDDITLGVALTALFALSALYGYRTTSDCDDAKAEWQRERFRPVYVPPPYPYPYPPPPTAAPPPAAPPPPATVPVEPPPAAGPEAADAGSSAP
jgi:hypothetical protein